MNFGLYLPLLVALALFSHNDQQRRIQTRAALPAALTLAACSTVIQCGSAVLFSLLPPPQDGQLMLPALACSSACALLLQLALRLDLRRTAVTQGLSLPLLWLNSLPAALLLPALQYAAPLWQLLAPLLLSALYALLLAQFATLPDYLQRLSLPSACRGKPALMLAAAMMALALHGLGDQLS